jgi:hypothetical protein
MGDGLIQFLNPKLGTHPKGGSLKDKSEFRNPHSEIGGPHSEIGDPHSDIRNLRSEIERGLALLPRVALSGLGPD